MVERWWNKIPEKFSGVECDAFVVMPNHVHFIVINKTGAMKGEHAGSPVQSEKGISLSAVVQWFKIMTTNEYIHGVKEQGWPRFDERLWKKNYWERIIRDTEWDSTRDYIRNNPANWATDRLNQPNLP